jgi:hypothetical protein
MPVTKRATRPKRSAAEEPVDARAIDTERDGAAGETFEEIGARVAERSLEPSARRAQRDRQEKEALDVAAGASAEGTIRAIGELRVQLNAALDEMATALADQARQAAALAEAVSLRRKELAELHSIDIAADTLAALIARHEAERAAFEREGADARQSKEAEYKRLVERIEEDKVAARRQWEREREEYEYNERVRREREQREEADRLQAAQAAQTAERTRADQALLEREKAVTAREHELAELQRQVALFPSELEAAVARAREQATSGVEDRARHEAELRAKDSEASDKLLKLRIQTLEQAVKEQLARIEVLGNELRQANERSQALAVKVIEGAAVSTAHARGVELATPKPRGET